MQLPPYFGKQDSIKKTANKKEDKVYKHILSGALSFKGDFSTDVAVIDQKSTIKQSISVTTKMCDKLVQDALQMGKEQSILLLDLPKYYLICKVVTKADIEK